MSQEEGEEEGNEVHLGLPCGRQKAFIISLPIDYVKNLYYYY